MAREEVLDHSEVMTALRGYLLYVSLSVSAPGVKRTGQLARLLYRYPSRIATESISLEHNSKMVILRRLGSPMRTEQETTYLCSHNYSWRLLWSRQ